MADGTRRDTLRTLAAAAGALVLLPAVTAARCRRTKDLAHDPTAPADMAPHQGHGEPGEFTETYRGRRIRGTWTVAAVPAGHGGHGGGGAGGWRITVDGRPLPLMRRADGGWISMVDHYESYPTPLAAARGAVDVLAPGTHLLPAADPERDTGVGTAAHRM